MTSRVPSQSVVYSQADLPSCYCINTYIDIVFYFLDNTLQALHFLQFVSAKNLGLVILFYSLSPLFPNEISLFLP